MIGIERAVTNSILENIDHDLILLLVGARQTGKTTLLKQIKEYLTSKSQPVFSLNLEDPTYLGLLNEHPKNVLKIFPLDTKAKNFVIIDEIQYLDNPTNFLKYLYDEFRESIKLIVSGSSAFYIDEKFKDSLAGRKKIFEIRTLSYLEFLFFKNRKELIGKTSLSFSEQEENKSLFDEYITWGGFPRVVLSDRQEKESLLQELAYSYIKKDIYESRIKQDEIVYRLFKILAEQVGSLVNINELSRTLGVSKTAIEKYLHVLQKAYHLAVVRPFYKNIRKELTKMPKIFFYDLGLRNFFYNDFSSPATRRDLGALLENVVFRQLLDKYHDLDKIKFWRTLQKNEVDFVIDGKKAFEVKSSPKLFKPSKYQQFKSSYPDIQLDLISYTKDPAHKSSLPYEI